MTSLTIHLLYRALMVSRHPHDILSTLDILVLCVLAMCLQYGRARMLTNPREAFVIAWISSMGTIATWVLAVLLLSRAGLA